MKKVDLRSDTITLPTKEMLDAITSAELGDDVFQEDPTVNRLEDLAATKFNKQAALFVPSGTMANLSESGGWDTFTGGYKKVYQKRRCALSANKINLS